MKLVNLCLFEEGYYSGSTYEDNIWIKKSSYEKLRDIFPTEISCGELDGKHSDVIGEVEIQNDWHTDEEYSKACDTKHDGDYLEWELKELYKENNLDWNSEQKEIKEYFNNLDVWEEVTVSIPLSKKFELMKFVKTLK